MDTAKLATRFMIAVTVPLLLAGAITAVAPVTADAGIMSTGLTASFSVNGLLSGVAATSASNAWAVAPTAAARP